MKKITKVEEVYQEIETLSAEEALEVLGLYFNTKGLQDMLAYYTVGAFDLEDTSSETQTTCAEILKVIELARRHIENKNARNR